MDQLRKRNSHGDYYCQYCKRSYSRAVFEVHSKICPELPKPGSITDPEIKPKPETREDPKEGQNLKDQYVKATEATLLKLSLKELRPLAKAYGMNPKIANDGATLKKALVAYITKKRTEEEHGRK